MIPYYILAIEDETDRAYMTALFFQYQKLMYSTIQKVTNDHWLIDDICGVNQTVKSYAFMDPAVGEYCAGTIYTSSGKWSFISESSGNRFTMNGYGYYDG